MGFWIFMTIMDLLIPIMMIGFGRYFLKHPPSEINGVFGYRMARSMKNMDTWTFAHHHCGKLWHKIGWALLFLSASAMLAVVGKPEETVGAAGGVVCAVQLVFLTGSIVPTEMALKKTFDENGLRRR